MSIRQSILESSSLMEEGTRKYVGCVKFSVLHGRQVFCKTTF